MKKKPDHPIITEAKKWFPKQAALRRATGYSKGRIHHWYNNRNWPDAEAQKRIREAIEKKRGAPIPTGPLIINHGEVEYLCRPSDAIEESDLVSESGKIGRWNRSDRHNALWIFIPLDGSRAETFDGKPYLKAIPLSKGES